MRPVVATGDASQGRGATQESRSQARPQSETASRRLYRIPEAMRLLSMSRSVIYEQIRAGRLRSVTQGRARLIPAAAIDDYIALLMNEAEGRAYGESA